MNKKWKVVFSLALILSMCLTNIAPWIPVETVEATDSESDVLFHENFDDDGLEELSTHELAERYFGKNGVEYRLGGAGEQEAKMEIKDGKLHLIGAGKSASPDRSQLLLASDERVKEQGIVIECDYTFHAASGFIDFLGKPIYIQNNSVENGRYWVAGVWAVDGTGTLRAGLREVGMVTEGRNNFNWKVDEGNTKDGTYYRTVDENYHLRLEVSPVTGVTLRIGKTGTDKYDAVAKYSVEQVQDLGFQFTDLMDNSVRMMFPSETDVSIDNLNVSLIPLDDGILFENDFDRSEIAGLTNAELGTELFGANRFRLGGEGDGMATMSIENGKLRLKGDSGKTNVDRSQILLAQDVRIAEQGVIIECDYTLNEGSSNFFNFLSKPLVATGASLEAGTYWIAGVWGSTENKLRAGLRDTVKGKGWKIGYNDVTDSKKYAAVNTEYHFRLEVSPINGITLRVGKAGTEIYDTTARYSIENIEAAGFTFSDITDSCVRMMFCKLVDVSIDNLKVRLNPKKATLDTDVLFYNDFNNKDIRSLKDSELATEIFGANVSGQAGKYRLGSKESAKAGMEITSDGKLHLTGKNSSDSQLLLASHKDVPKRGILIECEYTLNEGAGEFFDFLGKPVNQTNTIANDAWTSGVWTANSNTFRTCLRIVSSWEACGKLAGAGNYGFNIMGVPCNLKLEVSPVKGMTLSIKKASASDYTVVQTLTIEEMKAKGYSLSTYMDENVRMIYAAKQDVTIDNLKVSLLPHDYTTGGICKVCGALKDGLSGIYSASVSLDGNIGLNFYMELADKVKSDADAYVQFTLPDSEGGTKTETVNVKEAEIREDGRYKFSCDVAAKEMTDEVKLQVFTTSNGKGTEFTYSVKKYADAALKNAEQEEAAKTLIKAMLNYGTSAQQYFTYQIGKPANADLEPNDQKVTGLASYDAYKYTIDGTLPEGVSVYSATLLVESRTTIKCRFKIASDFDVDSLTLSEGWSKLETDGKYYYTEYRNIAAKDLATPVTLTVTCNGNSWSLNYSALSYVEQVQRNADNLPDAKKNITNALYDYWKAADAYFNVGK